MQLGAFCSLAHMNEVNQLVVDILLNKKGADLGTDLS